ncbi:MAG: hypothetical protein HQL44_08270 [Alphaproteobacteria bacterium]|nr:hypothetical protein [Alphaproteobacteria bacterium]
MSSEKRFDLVYLFLAFGLILLGLIWSGVYMGLSAIAPQDGMAARLLIASGLVGSGLTLGGTGLLLWQIRRQRGVEHRLLSREAELIAARESLERSNDELKNFARIIAHDLQEPLRAIISYTQLLKLRYGNRLDADADEFIGYLVAGAASMKARLMDLLDYTMIEQHTLKPEPVALQEIIQDIQNYLADEIKAAGAEIELGPLPIVLATKKRMILIFEHLLSNALEYKDALRPLKISISSKDVGGGLHEISFADNGIGIEPKYFERIFVIFQRLHTVAQHSGTGVGLAICKKIVEQSGGRITVESVFGQGTVFRFTLPAAAADKIDET